VWMFGRSKVPVFCTYPSPTQVETTPSPTSCRGYVARYSIGNEVLHEFTRFLSTRCQFVGVGQRIPATSATSLAGTYAFRRKSYFGNTLLQLFLSRRQIAVPKPRVIARRDRFVAVPVTAGPMWTDDSPFLHGRTPEVLLASSVSNL